MIYEVYESGSPNFVAAFQRWEDVDQYLSSMFDVRFPIFDRGLVILVQGEPIGRIEFNDDFPLAAYGRIPYVRLQAITPNTKGKTK